MNRRILLCAAALALLLFTPSAWAGEIHRAIEAGDLEQVRQLLDADPSLLTAPDENQTLDLPLHTAAVGGHLGIVALLLDRGAAIDAGDVDGSTALGVAALRGHEPLVRLLLERGASVNRRDRNGAYALSFAVSGGDPAIVQLLLEAGADLHYRSVDGGNLLHLACARGSEQFCQIFAELGVDPEATDNEGQTPLHRSSWRGNSGVVASLLSQGVGADPADENGQSPLMLLAFGGHVEAARALIERGADVNRRDINNNTALHMACWRRQDAYLDLLLEHGADPNVVANNGDTALLLAAARGGTAMVRSLLDAGAEVDQVHGNKGVTALQLAATGGYGDVVELLADRGASLDVADPHGNTPLCLARRFGHEELARALEARGASTLDGRDEPRCGISVAGELDREELVVRYLGHSGYAVQTREHLLVFDYAPGDRRLPDQPSILNGCICPSELKDRKVVFFASHAHGDHYDPAIFALRQELPRATYVLGFEPQEAPEGDYELVEARQVREIGGLRVTTIASNDSGVGFVVEVDGNVVFHAGDHANRHRDFSGNYLAEIDYLTERGLRPDVAFLPISGCNFGDQEAVRLGVYRTLELMQPTLFVPMHGGNDCSRYRDFLDACQPEFPGLRMAAPEGYGDAFRLRDGRVG